MKIKVLVVDDTIFYRKIISDILQTFPEVDVVGTASNGKIALSRIMTLKPDLLTLDIEMPVMDGLQLLREIQKQKLNVECVMLSSKTLKGSEATMQALELGAFDFIPKPDETSAETNKAQIRTSLNNILSAFCRRLEMKEKLRSKLSLTRKGPVVRPVAALKPSVKGFKRTEKSQAIAIGISTGGPNALAGMLPRLPADLGVPILLVQHMPPAFTTSLATSLDKKCALKVKEAENGETVKPNMVYIAPGGMQMKVASSADFKKIIRIIDDPPENNCKPSVDYMFRSVAREFGSKSTCVVMTGMGADGRLGLSVTKAAGAISIAQDEETCVVYGMPKAVVDAGLADVVVPLDSIADEIMKTI
ncbi:MAG: chemotaxis response regulator protein-glutamate methylesterase [Thermodesulfobacteriota bacterium]|nr:chemotaxis response regulator protein-glutamate methylesterase [Thermodesulfobacteriota bacterium]